MIGCERNIKNVTTKSCHLATVGWQQLAVGNNKK
jgi:hypothetical protein